MPDGSLKSSTLEPVADIDACYQPNHDECNRQRFIGALRRHVVFDMRNSMAEHYEKNVEAKLAHDAAQGPDVGWRAIRDAMQTEASYRFYSSIRYNVQEMCFLSVQEPIERGLNDMISVARDAALRNPSGGSLRLQPDLPTPRYVSALDVHLMPGCFHSEFTDEDVAQGAMAAYGGEVFTGGLAHKWGKRGSIGDSMARWIKGRFPDFKPRRVLDLGTTTGKNLIPYLDAFPGIEAYAVDVGAPCLRFGHAQAEHAGLPIHFSQQNAEQLDFPDEHFDLIVSAMFFHEVPVVGIKRILAECHRLLATGGVTVHMELPPTKMVGPWQNFVWDWDTHYNNEPGFTKFRQQDPTELCVHAGFSRDRCFELLIPVFATTGAQKFRQFLEGKAEAPMHGEGGWFIFGAAKR